MSVCRVSSRNEFIVYAVENLVEGEFVFVHILGLTTRALATLTEDDPESMWVYHLA